MSKISEILKAEPRQFSMHQELQNAGNLITAARTKLVSAKDSAAAELDSAASKLIRIILALSPKYDLGIVVTDLNLSNVVTGLGPDTEEMLTQIRDLQGVVDARNAEIAELKAAVLSEKSRADALAVKATAAAVVADEASPLAAPLPPDAPAPKKAKGGKPKAIESQPAADEPKADEPKADEPKADEPA